MFETVLPETVFGPFPISGLLKKGGWVYWPFFTQISGRNFLPQLRGEVHPETALSELCAVPLPLQNRALFKEEKRAERCREKERKRVRQHKGQKGKKDARKQVSLRGVAVMTETANTLTLQALLFLGKKKGEEPPKQARIFLSADPLKSLEKKGTTHKKARKIVTLPALQKTFVDFFSGFAWGFCIEKCRGFLVNFFWSPFPTKRSTKTPQKIRGKFGVKFGAKFGTKIRKIRETFVLRLFWPKKSQNDKNEEIEIKRQGLEGQGNAQIIPQEYFSVLARVVMQARHVFAPKWIPPRIWCEYVEKSSSKLFSCIRTCANTGTACIRAKNSSPRTLPALLSLYRGGVTLKTVTSLN